MAESREDREFRWALARAMNAIQLETQAAREAAFRRLEADFDWFIASNAWREARRIKRDVDEAVDKSGGDRR